MVLRNQYLYTAPFCHTTRSRMCNFRYEHYINNMVARFSIWPTARQFTIYNSWRFLTRFFLFRSYLLKFGNGDGFKMVTNGVKKQEQVTTTANNKQNNKGDKNGEKKTFAKMSVGEKVRHLREVVTVEPVMGKFLFYINNTYIKSSTFTSIFCTKIDRINRNFLVENLKKYYGLV